MRRYIGVLLAISTILLAGCSAVRVSQDYDPQATLSAVGTFAWQYAVQPETGDVRIDNPLLDRRIRTAVVRHLAVRGANQVESQPDYYLAYHFVIASRIESDPDYPVVGAGWPHFPWYHRYEREFRVHQFDECRLAIDLISGHLKTLVWRGTGIYRFKTFDDPQAAATDMQQTVDRILAQFPPMNGTR